MVPRRVGWPWARYLAIAIDSEIVPSGVCRRGNLPVVFKALNSLEFLVSSETTSTSTILPLISAATLPTKE